MHDKPGCGRVCRLATRRLLRREHDNDDDDNDDNFDRFDGRVCFSAAAAWDYIIHTDRYKKGLVDIADISNRLRHKAECVGTGPVYSEADILEAIEQSVGSGSDELL